MTQQDHIDHWLATAERDTQVVAHLFDGRFYAEGLFRAHLTLEKLAKAAWIKDNYQRRGPHPPRIHNLIVLLDATGYDFDDSQRDFFSYMNKFQIVGRYPEELYEAEKSVTEQAAQDIRAQYEQERLCLLEYLS